MLKYLVDDIRTKGGKAVVSVPITGINGLTAIADAIIKPVDSSLPPFILEVKTGADPTYTFNQRLVYPLVCFGFHAVSVKPGILEVGLTPGVPLPPLNVIAARVDGPNLPINYINECDDYLNGKNEIQQ